MVYEGDAVRDLDGQMRHIEDKIEDISETVHKIDKDLAVYRNTFDEHLKQDEKMYEEFKRMNDILQQNTDSLKEHMYRTELAEQQLKALTDFTQNLAERFSPVERQFIENQAIRQYRREKFVSIAKIIGIIGAITGIITGILKLI